MEQLKKGCLSPERLELKEGALVMFTKNSITGAFVNGTLGEVTGFERATNYPIIKTRRGRTLTAEPMEWTIEEEGRVRARIAQIPLRLAWAMTIHKSQGMSLDAAYIDLRKSFVRGQGYVALSRVRTLAGLILSGWNSIALEVNPQVLSRDEAFRESSANTAKAFTDLEGQELGNLQENFVRFCGGTLPKEREKTYSVDAIRQKHSNAYKPWEDREDHLCRKEVIMSHSREIEMSHPWYNDAVNLNGITYGIYHYVKERIKSSRCDQSPHSARHYRVIRSTIAQTLSSPHLAY